MDDTIHSFASIVTTFGCDPTSIASENYLNIQQGAKKNTKPTVINLKKIAHEIIHAVPHLNQYRQDDLGFTKKN